MSEFWSLMAPWLIAAVFLPGWIVLWLWIRPSDEWYERVIQEWADSEGWRVAAIDDFHWYDRLLAKIYKVDRVRMANTRTNRVYRVRVVDKKGCERECKAVVGYLLLWPTSRNIAIKWIKPR
jgi:hypothetical protein